MQLNDQIAYTSRQVSSGKVAYSSYTDSSILSKDSLLQTEYNLIFMIDTKVIITIYLTSY